MHLILHPQMNYTPHIQYLNHVPTNSIIPTNVMAPIIITRFIAVAFGHKYISYRLHQNFHYLLTRTFKHNTLLLIRIRHWTMDVWCFFSPETAVPKMVIKQSLCDCEFVIVIVIVFMCMRVASLLWGGAQKIDWTLRSPQQLC